MTPLAHKTRRGNHTINGRFHTPYFNGKEKDRESGFHYYGARYYWSEVLTGWLSVDPMMDKYPNISPYAYCIWNPVKLTDPNGEVPILYGLLQYQGLSKHGNDHVGETQMVGDFHVVPFYDNNNNLIGYNAGRFRSDGSYATEYQMEPDDIEMFSRNVKTYEAAANLVYCNGEPDWSMLAFEDDFFSGDLGGALIEFSRIWRNALSDPSFYYSVAAAITLTGSTYTKVRCYAGKLGRWIGKEAKVIINPNNDIIVVSKDGLRQIRFDVNHPAPHKNPHVHFETRKSPQGPFKSIRRWPRDVKPE